MDSDRTNLISENDQQIQALREGGESFACARSCAVQREEYMQGGC